MFETICRRFRKKDGYQDLFIKMDNLFYTDGIIPYERDLKQTTYKLIVGALVVSLACTGEKLYQNVNRSFKIMLSHARGN